jgi:hypothetical protein
MAASTLPSRPTCSTPAASTSLKRWESQAAVETFRRSAPRNKHGTAMLSVSVAEYDIADVRPLFGKAEREPAARTVPRPMRSVLPGPTELPRTRPHHRIHDRRASWAPDHRSVPPLWASPTWRTTAGRGSHGAPRRPHCVRRSPAASKSWTFTGSIRFLSLSTSGGSTSGAAAHAARSPQQCSSRCRPQGSFRGSSVARASHRWKEKCCFAWIAGCRASRNPQILARDRDSLVSEILSTGRPKSSPSSSSTN